jgi:hypothetical protein
MAREIATHLARAEAGESQGWWGLNHVLIFDEHGRETVTGELEPDLRKLPGWTRMRPDDQARALSAAKRYVVEGDPQPEQWFGTLTIFKPAFAGYRALCLIAALDSAWLDALPAETWTRWAPIIVGYPLSNYSEEPVHGEVLRRAIAADPVAVAGWLLREIDADNERSGTLFGLWRLRDVSAPEVIDAIAEKAEDSALTATARASLVEFTLTHDRPRGIEIATRVLTRDVPPADGTDDHDYVARVAAILLRLAARDTWRQVASVLASDSAVGRAVFEHIVEGDRDGAGTELGDRQLAELVQALFALFPPEEDPPLGPGAQGVSRREQLGRLRDGLLSVLAERGSDAAVDAIAHLHNADPESHVVRFRLRDAREARRAQWPAPDPGDIIKLAHATDARIVTSATHLQQLLVASLRRAEAALQGTPPRARELWNQEPTTPKDEGALSDWLQAWFDQDLRLGGIYVVGAYDALDSRSPTRHSPRPGIAHPRLDVREIDDLSDLARGASELRRATFDFLASLGPRERGRAISAQLGRAACQAGHRVRFLVADELVEELHRGLADNSIGKLIAGLLRNDVVIIDDLGFTALDRIAAEHFFRFIAAAYERRSLIVSTNVSFERWTDFLPEETVATAILDRLLHHCHVIRLAGESYRLREARELVTPA